MWHFIYFFKIDSWCPCYYHCFSLVTNKIGQKLNGIPIFVDIKILNNNNNTHTKNTYSKLFLIIFFLFLYLLFVIRSYFSFFRWCVLVTAACARFKTVCAQLRSYTRKYTLFLKRIFTSFLLLASLLSEHNN